MLVGLAGVLTVEAGAVTLDAPSMSVAEQKRHTEECEAGNAKSCDRMREYLAAREAAERAFVPTAKAALLTECLDGDGPSCCELNLSYYRIADLSEEPISESNAYQVVVLLLCYEVPLIEFDAEDLKHVPAACYGLGMLYLEKGDEFVSQGTPLEHAKNVLGKSCDAGYRPACEKLESLAARS
jgi:hypothetical protein